MGDEMLPQKWLGRLTGDGSLMFLCHVCNSYVSYENLSVVDYKQGHVCYYCKSDMDAFDKQRQERSGGDGR